MNLPFIPKDGKLPLPQGVGAYMLALSENENGVLFDLQEFTISRSQVIPLEVKAFNKRGSLPFIRDHSTKGYVGNRSRCKECR
jgi:hypothetical protein